MYIQCVVPALFLSLYIYLYSPGTQASNHKEHPLMTDVTPAKSQSKLNYDKETKGLWNIGLASRQDGDDLYGNVHHTVPSPSKSMP